MARSASATAATAETAVAATTRTATSDRQRWRRALLLVSFVAFPVTMNYFSPYLIVDSAFKGVVNGALVAFATMFVGSLVFGRLWCGWACPAGALQELARPVNGRRVGSKADFVKWAIWVPWIALVAYGAFAAGGYRSIDVLYGTEGGISVAGSPDRPVFIAYIIYFAVVALFLGITVAAGRRAGCRTVCWMAPFMIAGRWIRNRVAWPALRLVANTGACKRCGACTGECPMGLDVEHLVASGSMEHRECTLCGTCADACPNRTIRYSFSAGR
jgi:ferredoxin-type protein NapH